MAIILNANKFRIITQHVIRCLNMNSIEKHNEEVSILQPKNRIHPPLNAGLRNQLSTNIITRNLREVEIHSKNLSMKQVDILPFYCNNQYSMSFWGKQKNFPVKCKIKCNDFGERIAEPYIAKKPTPIKLARLSKDFTMNYDKKWEKLEGNKLSCESGTEIKPKLTRKKLESHVVAPNALTNYLQKKDQCNDIFRGSSETCSKYLLEKDCVSNEHNMDGCSRVFKGTEELSDKGKMPSTEDGKLKSPTESKSNKAKQIVHNLISKLKSMKLLKSSGFISGDLVFEAINQLRVNFPANNISPYSLTCAKETLASIKMPNCKKSLVRKFGERSKSQQFSTQQKFVDEPAFNKIRGKQSFIDPAEVDDRARSNFGSKFFQVMHRNKRSNIKIKKTENIKSLIRRDNVSKLYRDNIPVQNALAKTEEKSNKKNIKLKKNSTYKPKSRKGMRKLRKRRFSFSKIPIQPNVKGSVIILNETTQPLDDPCKILSVNFFQNNDIALEDLKIENDGINEYDTVVGQFTALKAKSNGFTKHSEAKKIPIKAKIFQGSPEGKQDFENKDKESDSNIESNKNQFSEGEVFVNLRTKKFDHLQKKEEKNSRSYSTPEPIIRRKKISKLDKNITSFITTVFPEEKPTKSLNKLKDNDSIQEKFGFINLDDNVKETLSNSQDVGKDYEVNEGEELDKSSTSSGSNFYQKIADIHNFKSEESILRTNEAIELKEKYSFADDLKNGKGGFRKGMSVSPGLTRPLTQKTAHLDILKTKPFAPISNMWKNSTASTGRLATSKKNRRKKAIKSSNNLMFFENKGPNWQQTRCKSSTSWKSKSGCEDDPCPTQKKDYDAKANSLYPLPNDWDYEGPAPPYLARKWATRQCPQDKDIGCPITSDDMKKGPPCKRPLSAAAINRCNYNECKNRMRSRKCGYKVSKKNDRGGAIKCECSNK